MLDLAEGAGQLLEADGEVVVAGGQLAHGVARAQEVLEPRLFLLREHDDLEPLVHDGRTLCFICGPPALVEEMPKVLLSLGVARERVRVEEWG